MPGNEDEDEDEAGNEDGSLDGNTMGIRLGYDGNTMGRFGWWRWIEILEKHHWTGIGAGHAGSSRDWAKKQR